MCNLKCELCVLEVKTATLRVHLRPHHVCVCARPKQIKCELYGHLMSELRAIDVRTLRVHL